MRRQQKAISPVSAENVNSVVDLGDWIWMKNSNHDSHSLRYNKFQDSSRTTEAFRKPAMFKYRDKQH